MKYLLLHKILRKTDLLCSCTSNDAVCTITKPESSKKIQRKNIFKKSHFSFCCIFFFFFRMSRPSSNLVIATELLIARSGRVSSNVGPRPFGFSFQEVLVEFYNRLSSISLLASHSNSTTSCTYQLLPHFFGESSTSLL